MSLTNWWFVGLVALILAALLVAATVYDLYYANKAKRDQLKAVGDLFPKPLTESQGSQVLALIGRPASGVSGLTRVC